MYEQADASLIVLKRRLQRSFVELGQISLDELNVLGARKLTKELYDALDRANRVQFEKIAASAYADGEQELIKAGFTAPDPKEKTELSEKWILALLAAYNAVTEYKYTAEVERKRMRTAEAMLAARDAGDFTIARRALKRPMNLWYTQTAQYADFVYDEAALEAYHDYGVEYVRWNIQKDGHACEGCLERDGEVYKLCEVPAKLHYGCRCWYTPVMKRDSAGNG